MDPHEQGGSINTVEVPRNSQPENSVVGKRYSVIKNRKYRMGGAMFGFRRKRTSPAMPPLDEQGKLMTAGWIATLLLMQTEEMPAGTLEEFQIQFRNGQVNARVLGYVYGFVYAAVTTVGQSMSDVSIAIPILNQVLKQVFPGGEAACLQFLSEHNTDGALNKAIEVGSNEYLASHNDERPSVGFSETLRREAHL
jgi:hypothetical protein